MQHAFRRQLGSSSLMTHFGQYGDDADVLLPTYPLYDEEYLPNAWPDSASFMDSWPDHSSAPAHFMNTSTGPLMMPEAVPACIQPASDESTIVVRQTVPEAAGNSEFEDIHLDTLPVGTPSRGLALTGDTLDELGSSIEVGRDSKSPCPSPGDLVSNLPSSLIPRPPPTS